MKISENVEVLGYFQQQQAAATSTAEMTTPSKSISKLDITNLENKIKVLGKQIDTIKDKHQQICNEKLSSEKKQAQ